MMISAARDGKPRDAHGDTNDEPLRKDDDEGHTTRSLRGPTSAEGENKIERERRSLPVPIGRLLASCYLSARPPLLPNHRERGRGPRGTACTFVLTRQGSVEILEVPWAEE